MIVNGSTEFAKSLKTCSRRVSKLYVQTCRRPPPNAPSSAEHQPRRQPRIFAIPSQMPTSAPKIEAPIDQNQVRRKAAIRRETREIPASQYGRVRTLTMYGMTQEQAAALYGVTVDEIERISRYPTTSKRETAR